MLDGTKENGLSGKVVKQIKPSSMKASIRNSAESAREQGALRTGKRVSNKRSGSAEPVQRESSSAGRLSQGSGLIAKDGAASEAAPKRKKLAVVFHSQNSVNHKNHPLGSRFTENKKTATPSSKTVAVAAPKEEKTPVRKSPNGRPLPPGTARVTPLRELNEIQRKREEQEAREEAERLRIEKEKAEAEAKAREAELRRQEEERKAAALAAKEKKIDSDSNASASPGKVGKTDETIKIGEAGKADEASAAGSKNATKTVSVVNLTGTANANADSAAPAASSAAAVSTASTTKKNADSTHESNRDRKDQREQKDQRTQRDQRDKKDNADRGSKGSFSRPFAKDEQSKDRKGGASRAESGRGDQNQKGRNASVKDGLRDGMKASGSGSQADSGDKTADKAGNRSRRDNQKPQKKAYGNKGFENEKAAISQKNRNSRKQQKYGAAQAYERDDQILHKGPKKAQKAVAVKPEPQKEEEIKSIIIPEIITIKELSEKMKRKAADIIKKLFMQGKIVTLNTEVDYEEAENIALDYDILCEKEEKVDVIAELVKDTEQDIDEELELRPPVVCVMGHVDHGKTSILDAIRNTNVTSHEHGGITQSIGAYQVKVGVNGEDRTITFLDTPGHEAFTAMRMRGAQSTDIAVLVVAADDGIMPQTVEAINHARAAGTEIVVAINKIDKPTANPEKVKQELMKYDLIPEEYGGNVICCPVSAKTGDGLEDLLENIVLEADVMELKANPNRKAYGVVIEAELDKGRGSVARLLVQKGTLKVGDVVAVGSSYGKVRAMTDDKGRRIKKAVPSMPVEILGLNSVPNAGEIFQVKDNEKEAKTYAQTFVSENRQKMIDDSKKKVSLDALFDQIKAGEIKELPIIVKADVQGSVEAVRDSLEKIQNEEVRVKVIHAAVGAINESDINLASASNAIVIGFDVKPDATAREIAERENVDFRLYNIIYKAIEDVENAMKGMLKPVYEERVVGHAVVRQIFKSSGVGVIAGSYVLDGQILKMGKARITRGKDQIFDGEIASVKRFKDDVKEVKAGYECGLVFEGFSDLQEEDQIECYVMEEVKRV